MPHDNETYKPQHCRCKEQGPAIRGFLIPCLLFLLKEAPCHGYQLIDKLQSSGYMSETPDPGVIYRHLRRLEQDNMVTSSFEAGGGPARKVYTITSEGQTFMKDWISKLSQLQTSLNLFLKDAGKN